MFSALIFLIISNLSSSKVEDFNSIIEESIENQKNFQYDLKQSLNSDPVDYEAGAPKPFNSSGSISQGSGPSSVPNTFPVRAELSDFKIKVDKQKQKAIKKEISASQKD
jgi:hypothetical protein